MIVRSTAFEDTSVLRTEAGGKLIPVPTLLIQADNGDGQHLRMRLKIPNFG